MTDVTDGSDSGGPPPASAPRPPGGPEGDLPEAAVRRLESTAFSSGLSVPDFAACLDLGLQPVALVQGFCVMQWGWYGPGSGFTRGMSPYAMGPQSSGAYSETSGHMSTVSRPPCGRSKPWPQCVNPKLVPSQGVLNHPW